jgi:orotidine-5'-phosphate decarboxylase
VKELKQFGNVFVDLKFHDIPATVEKEVSAMVAHGADLVTVHASGGVEMLKVAVAAGGEKVAAVTVLTSLPDADAVPRLARLAAEAGVSNLVCSPHEIGVVKEVAPKMCIITPGIRGPEDTANDQRRISSAREALLAGASLLVIGRPITKALHPERALEAIIASLV